MYVLYFLSCALPKQFNDIGGSTSFIQPKRNGFGCCKVLSKTTYIAFMSVFFVNSCVLVLILPIRIHFDSFAMPVTLA